MSCESCGRPTENGLPVHWLGCKVAAEQWAATVSETGKPAPLGADLKPETICEHDGCSEPKKPWAGRGARPKFCAAGHKKEK